MLQCLEKNRGLVDRTVDKWQIESHFAALRGTSRKKDLSRSSIRRLLTHVDKGYLRKVHESEAPSPEVSHSPHFLIVKLRKSTTKARIVFDCSAKCDGISLNDVIHAGLKLQRELFDVFSLFPLQPICPCL